MKKAIVIIAVLVFAATSVAALKLVRDHRIRARALPPLEKITTIDPAFEYEVFPGSRMRSFDMSTDVRIKRPDGTARLFFNYTDIDNHYYVDITPDVIEVVLMQDGIGRVLESAEVVVPVDEPLSVSLQRRETVIRVIVDDIVLASAYDDTLHSGKVGYARKSDEVEIGKPELQSIAEIYFADDFMRTLEGKSPWSDLRGNWRIYAIDHASMSANAFQYVVEGKEEGATVAGYSFWSDYSFEVSVRPKYDNTFGMYFYYRDENNYYRFEWHPEDTTKPGSGKMQLIRMWHGERAVLAEKPGGFQRKQWYQIECRVSAQRMQTLVDGTVVFDLRDHRLTSGMVGLFVADNNLPNNTVFFDDVFVRSYRCFEDRFTNGGRNAWSFMGGKWSRVIISPGSPGGTHSWNTSSGVMTVSLPSNKIGKPLEARAAIGSASWKNYVLETEIYPDSIGRTGVVLYYQDETRYYQVACDRSDKETETWTLERVLNGKHTVLDTSTVALSPGSRMLRAGIDDGYISVTVNGKRLLEGFDTALKSGRAGLFAAGVRESTFGPVKVDWPPPTPPLLTLNEVFEHEKSMANWSSVENEWFRTGGNVWLNKGDFPGDSSIEAGIEALPAGNAELGLVLSASEGSTKQGYVLKLARTGKSADAKFAMELHRKGEKVASRKIDVGTSISKVAFKRMGSYLVGYVNRMPMLTFRDETPLKGCTLGWYASSVKVDPKSVVVNSPNVHRYLFRKAYTDWRVVNGTWEVANRWQCDKRWTFFSGRSTRKLAAIWNKRKLKGNQTIDFYVGPKMNRLRGSNYEYAADMNCTLAGDGADLTSGYSFMFGAYNNTKTVLLRGDKIVAEGRWPSNSSRGRKNSGAVLISRVSLHHRWYHIKAQKRGPRLRMWVDDLLVIDYVDEKPLTGDRAAIWTWNNGIMIGRVTVSADDTTEREAPDTYHPVRCRSVYDESVVAAQ